MIGAKEKRGIDYSGGSIESPAATWGQKLRAQCGGLACRAAGVTLGAVLALNGAQYETEVAGIPADISMTAFSERHLRVTGDVVDPSAPPSDVGGIEFQNITPLPIGIDVQLRVNAGLVESLLQQDDAAELIKEVQSDAPEKTQQALQFFGRKALEGGLTGILAVETGLAIGRRKARGSHETTGTAGHFVRSTSSYLAVAALAGGSAVVSCQYRDWENSYQLVGGSGLTSSEAYRGTALGEIMSDVEAQNACPDSLPIMEAYPEGISVTTYNIKRGDVRGPRQIAEELRTSGSDVIALQEVTGPALDVIADELGMQAIPSWTIETDQLTYGNAILTRLPVHNMSSHPLPSEDVEPRRLLVTVLGLPDEKEVVVATTHLTNASQEFVADTNESLRREQADEVNHILSRTYFADKPVILTGDLNATPGSPLYAAQMDAGYRDVSMKTETENVATFPETGNRLDYIFTRPSRSGEGMRVEATTLGGANSSDHCSVSTVLSPTEPLYIVATRERALP